MAKPLIIVESPAKARTIGRFLGEEYQVESSIGHVRDLPSKPDEIPAAYRKKPWARLGVDVDNQFKPIYVVPTAKKAQVKKLKKALEEAPALYLATDEDREGEAIAWHLLEVLKPKVPVLRLAFHEITKRAIEQALEHPRELDTRLVGAQEARRILDRLFGYEVSPVLWRKVRPRLSAGRVQSVGTRLVVERERARMAFRSAEYWGVGGTFSATQGGASSPNFPAELAEFGGRRVASGRHFDAETGKLNSSATADRVLLLDENASSALRDAVAGQMLRVDSVQKKPFTQRPVAPFITSTLQQDAGRKLGYAAKRTMRVAQRLYESGYITYMRTDSTTLSQEGLEAARSAVVQSFGAEFLADKPRIYTRKVKGAQEAHEAIRPAGESFRAPASLQGELDSEAWRLYEIIWKRAVACQMKDARGERTQVRLTAEIPHQPLDGGRELPAGRALFLASGKVITFSGFLRAYHNGQAQSEADRADDRERLLPALGEGDVVAPIEVEARQHITQPPPRFTEAALVKVLEERGIGRPSTYATIIQTIQDRGYVWKQGNTLVPTLTAFAVVNLLERHFGELVDYEFTARMESELDEISSGDMEAVPWLERFYFGRRGKEAAPTDAGDKTGLSSAPAETTLKEGGLKGLIGVGVEHIDARAVCSLDVGQTGDGEVICARVGRYGPYLQVGDSERRANIADDLILDELDVEHALELLRLAALANRPLGVDSTTGKNIYVKNGSYGPYVQLGEPELTPKGNIKKGGKPKMASLWPGMEVESISVDEALLLLSFPRELGKHPETGAPITAQDGKFGPYIQTEHEEKRDTRSLESHEQLRTIDLAGALELFSKPRQRRGQRASAGPLAELGDSPVTGQKIVVREGRFGPYVTDGQVNATIPSHRDPQKVTFDDALEFIAAREQRMREQGKDPRAPKATRRRAASKTGVRKTGGRKSATAKGGRKKGTKKVVRKATPGKATLESTGSMASPTRDEEQTSLG